METWVPGTGPLRFSGFPRGLTLWIVVYLCAFRLRAPQNVLVLPPETLIPCTVSIDDDANFLLLRITHLSISDNDCAGILVAPSSQEFARYTTLNTILTAPTCYRFCCISSGANRVQVEVTPTVTAIFAKVRLQSRKAPMRER